MCHRRCGSACPAVNGKAPLCSLAEFSADDVFFGSTVGSLFRLPIHVLEWSDAPSEEVLCAFARRTMTPTPGRAPPSLPSVCASDPPALPLQSIPPPPLRNEILVHWTKT